MFEVGSLLFVERSIIGGITNMQSTISSGLTQQVWGSQCWHSIKKSELNTSDDELTERNKAKIGELVADDFVRSKRPNAKLLHPKDIGTSISKPGEFDMIY
ncbi:hypothetical protein [Vibrio sp. Y53_MX_L15]|uniref:hypothetical protein n=2 Tax=unclassified Vibrio TaxID=2614977 RepID=UPI002815C271|nr:hypothetical protein [Vibrio sp. Y53_MX_L15]